MAQAAVTLHIEPDDTINVRKLDNGRTMVSIENNFLLFSSVADLRRLVDAIDLHLAAPNGGAS